MKPKNPILIFVRKSSLKPIGGYVAVCYYYDMEQTKRNEHIFEFLLTSENNDNLHKKESILDKFPSFIKKIYKTLKNIYKYNVLLSGNYPVRYFDFNKYSVVHFHDSLSLYLYSDLLKNYKGKVILQSHTPQPQSHEIINSLSTFEKWFIPNIKKRFEKIERTAFLRADLIIFPCKDAEEPYINNWSYYKEIQKLKAESYRYVLTGIPEACAKRNKYEICKELNIPHEDFIITYVGRHNIVKGYDSLKRIGSSILNRNNDIWIVCAGTESPLKRLQNKRWIEIGWTKDAHSYIAASDVFILPNKETYFDIVMLEILSLGKIVIASRTGGNKFFERMGCEGVLLYDNEAEAINLIEKVKHMTSDEKEYLERKNRQFYNNYLTVSSMYDSYKALLEEITTMPK